MKGICQKKIFAVLFAGMLFITGFVSDFKVMKFYINEEVINNDWTVSAEGKFETDYISCFWLKYSYVNINGLASRILGQKEMNGVVKLDNGYLVRVMNEMPDEVVEQGADKTKIFSDSMKERGIQYIYVVLPYVIDKYDPQLPLGIADYGNINLDKIAGTFSEKGIELIDLREELRGEGLSTYDIFYRTDHHWTTKGGFWAFERIVDYLERGGGFVVDEKIKNLDNYYVTTYVNWHLGSNGRRTGIYYAGVDDFELILPKFDTCIEMFGTGVEGSFENMINMKPLDKREYYAASSVYDGVLSPLTNWHNPNAPVDKTVLIIGDSMARAFNPYMTLAFSNVLFMEWNRISDLDQDYLDIYAPDIIISFYYPSNAFYPGTYEWNRFETE